MEKNVASQAWTVFAFNRTTNVPLTGDSANITANIKIGAAGAAATNDVNPTELEDGYYSFDLTQAETNANKLLIFPVSATADIQVIGVHGVEWTNPVDFPDDIIQTGDNFARIGAPVGASISADIADKTGYSLASTGLDAITQAATGMVEIAKAIWDRVLTGGTHNINNSAGRRLRQLGGSIFTDGTAQAGAANSLQLASGDVSIDNQYKSSKVIITAGTGAGQEAIITSSTASTDTIFTTPVWLVTPDNTSDYEVIPAQVHATVRNGGYDGGFVYVNTITGNTGQVPEVNGTTTNPCKNLTDAYALAVLEKLSSFFIEPGSSVTLPSDSSDMVFSGSGYDVALNNQNIDNSRFVGASVTGIATADSNNAPAFILCGIGTATLPPCNGNEVGFFGTLTLGSAGNYTFGHSAAVFDLSLVIDYGSGLNASEFYLQSYGGGEVEIQNAGAGTGTYKFQMNGYGNLTVNANCSATTEVTLRGHISRNADVSGITYIETASTVGLIGTPATDVSTDIAAVKTVSDGIQTDLDNGTDGLGALKTLIDTVNTDLSNGTDGLGALLAAINATFTTAITESYAADGVAPTPAQALMLIQQRLTEFAISGTTLTIKKLDGTTTAATLTHDSATAPTSATRTT